MREIVKWVGRKVLTNYKCESQLYCDIFLSIYSLQKNKA